MLAAGSAAGRGGPLAAVGPPGFLHSHVTVLHL